MAASSALLGHRAASHMGDSLASALQRRYGSVDPHASYVSIPASSMSTAEKRRLLGKTIASPSLSSAPQHPPHAAPEPAPAPESTGGTPSHISAPSGPICSPVPPLEEAVSLHVVLYSSSRGAPCALALLSYSSTLPLHMTPVSDLNLSEGALLHVSSDATRMHARFTPPPWSNACSHPPAACTAVTCTSTDTGTRASACAQALSGEIELDLPLTGGTRASSVEVHREYVLSVESEGHMLTVGVPLLPRARMDVSITLLDSNPAVCGAVRDVICVTHDSKLAGVGSHHVTGTVHACSRLEPDAAASPCLIMIEPHNLNCTWLVQRSLTDAVADALHAVSSRPSPASPSSPRALHDADTDSRTHAVSPPAAQVAATGSVATLTASQLPRHIAIVMDGNGRWAASRGLGRSQGHTAGVGAIHTIIRACRRLGVPFLTLYAFSSQNWSRPRDEVATLMKLLIDFVHTDCEELIANGVRLLVNGDMTRLPAIARSGLQRLITSSAHNSGLTLILALSYGGREEIVAAAAAACAAARAGELDPSGLTVDAFRAFLPHPDVPDPDLLIRTSGELRISNFLLWHIAYTELYVTDTLWPDFDDAALMLALRAYAARERRFGLTSSQIATGQASLVSDAVRMVARASSAAAQQHANVALPWWIQQASSWYSWYTRKPRTRAASGHPAATASPEVSSDEARPAVVPLRRRRKPVRARVRRDAPVPHAGPLQVTQGSMSCSAPLFMLALLPLLLLASTLGYLVRTSTVAGMADAWAHATVHPPGAVEVPLCRLPPPVEQTFASASGDGVHASARASAQPEDGRGSDSSPTLFATQRSQTSAWWGTMTGVVRHTACSMAGCMDTGLGTGTPLPSRSAPLARGIAVSSDSSALHE